MAAAAVNVASFETVSYSRWSGFFPPPPPPLQLNKVVKLLFQMPVAVLPLSGGESTLLEDTGN